MAHLEPELLSAYIDHELPAADVAAVERHLATCDVCRSEHEELLALSTLVRDLPVYLPKREIDVSAYPRGGSDTLAKIVAFSRPLAVAAIILLVAFAGFRLISQMGDDSNDDSQISFSAVQPTPSGTSIVGEASDQQEAEEVGAANRAVNSAPMAAAPSQGTQAAMMEVAPSQATEAPAAAAAAQPTEAPTAVPTAQPEPVARDSNGRSRLPEAVVAVVVVLLAGAAGWYKLTRPPGRPRA